MGLKPTSQNITPSGWHLYLENVRFHKVIQMMGIVQEATFGNPLAEMSSRMKYVRIILSEQEPLKKSSEMNRENVTSLFHRCCGCQHGN